MNRLGKDFFLQDSLFVAKNLLGKEILFNINNIQSSAIITETEAYFGNDAASHGSRGKTKSNEAMFLKGGVTYVYMIYGMYFCLNFVTEQADFPAAVLIRGIRVRKPELKIIDGPGKLCKYFNINKNHNKIDICDGNLIAIYDNHKKVKIEATPRIGITKNIDKLWRFIIA